MNPPRIDPALTVNEILRRFPEAVTVMNAFGIDSCCGGGIPLATVAERHQLDLTAIIAALETAVPAEVA